MIRRLTTIFFIAFTCAAFQFPTAGEYEHVTDFRGKVQESEVENSWTENPTRKASENKRPWDNESFLDMEGYVSPGFDDWAMPEFADFNPWDVAPAPTHGPNDIFLPIWHMAGCGLSVSPIFLIDDDCQDLKSILVHFFYKHGPVVDWGIEGPVLDVTQIEGEPFPVYDITAMPNATYGSEIKFWAKTRSLKNGVADGFCDITIGLYCDTECPCDGYPIEIYASSDEIAAGDSITLYADSGGLACPPYTWTVSGTGYSLDTDTTENDKDTVTLTSAAGT